MNGVIVEAENSAGIQERRSAVDVANGARWSGDADRVSTYPAGDRTSLLRAHGAARSVEVAPASPRVRRAPRESRRVSLAQASGYVQLNQYRLLEPIGQGSYGIVKLAYNEEDDTHYAMKILSKRKLMRRAGLFGRAPPRKQGPGPPPDPLQRVYREIAVLKKLDHPNVVKLVEVLDDPAEDQLYLVFQLLEGGPVIEIPTENPLSEDVARKYFRDVLLGVEYLHYQGIAHRDIKPANLLLGEGRVQVADLGAAGELASRLSGAVGTPAFRAPEATASTENYGGEAADIWSLGVTLFAMVTGRVPWGGSSAAELQRRVLADPLAYPRAPPSAPLRRLLSAMLHKDPEKRITLQETKEHEWVTADGTEPLPSEQENCRLVEVTDEDMARVVTSIPNLSTLILIKTMLKKHSFQNPFLRSREGSTARRESVSTRGEGSSGPGAVGEEQKTSRRGGLLARAGRSLSAPGNYMTERQASFDVALESVQEGLDQSQDIPTAPNKDPTTSESPGHSTSQSVSTSQNVTTQSADSKTASTNQSIEIKSANSSKCVSRSQSVSDNQSLTSPSVSDIQSLNSSQKSISQKSDSQGENGKKSVNNSHSFRLNHDSVNTVSTSQNVSANKSTNATQCVTTKVSTTKHNSNNHSVSSQIANRQSVSSHAVSGHGVNKQGVSSQTVIRQNVSSHTVGSGSVTKQNVTSQVVSKQNVSRQNISSQDVGSGKNSQRKSSQEVSER